MGAAGFEGADLLVVFEFEEEVEFGVGYVTVAGVAVVRWSGRCGRVVRAEGGWVGRGGDFVQGFACR